MSCYIRIEVDDVDDILRDWFSEELISNEILLEFIREEMWGNQEFISQVEDLVEDAKERLQRRRE